MILPSAQASDASNQVSSAVSSTFFGFRMACERIATPVQAIAHPNAPIENVLGCVFKCQKILISMR